MPQIKQLLFDCDNTLVLSEYVAFEACAELANQLLAEHGITDRYTNERLIVEFLGQTFKGMMLSLSKKYEFELSQDRIDYYIKQEENAVIARLQKKGVPCDGSSEILETLHNEKKYGLAVVSSSALPRIRASLEKVGQDKFIPYNHVFSATTSLDKPATKPNPAVYIHAMEKLGVKPEECVTVEDSKSGALAAIRANVPCIAYVGAYRTKDKQNMVANTLMDLGCKHVMSHWSQYFDIIKRIEQA